MKPEKAHDIDREAAVWIERMSRAVQDSEIAAAFDCWIVADPRHAESYARLSALWHADALEQALYSGVPLNDNDLSESADNGAAMSAPSIVGAVRRWSGNRLAGIAAAFAAAIVAVPLAQGVMAPDIAYSAPRGENRAISLPDGSTITLASGARLSARITPWSRRVTMESGGAFFDVAHENLRGFEVDTGTARVAVLGTAFDIDLVEDGGREVRVFRGEVSVEAGNGEWRLPAGSGLAIGANRVRSLDDVEGQRPAWIYGWFDAQETTLSRLVERLNRNSPHAVQLSEPELGELQVTGRFRLNRPEEMLETLATIHGLTWREEGDHYILSRR